MITRTKVSIAALALATGLAACADKGSTSAEQDLQRDLQLATASTMNLATPRVDSSLLNSMETKPAATPQPAPTVRRGAGSRAVRSEAPTVLATPDVDVAAVAESNEAEAESIAPAPESSEPVAVAPRPAPVVIPASGDYGTGSGGGIFGGGSGTGVVIRGGGVDGDNCELHRRPRGVPTSRGPVYVPTSIPQTAGGTWGGMPTRPRGSGIDRTLPTRAPQRIGRGGFSSMRTRR
ncbi:MAG: hypothetical protein ACRENU_02555 [Gemmatimonadaceae bacterium]